MESILLMYDIVMCTLIVWLLFSDGDDTDDTDDTDDFN